MTIHDWRRTDAGLLRVCYDVEWRHWADELAWDTAWTWATIERARTSRGLPGLIATDERGRPRGWAFYLIDGSQLNIGGLVAADETVTGALLDRILAAATGDIDVTSCFILDRAAGLTAALEARGFDVERFHYLSRVLEVPRSPVAPGRGRPDVDGLASLLHAAYTTERARRFAPGGTLGGWRRYVTGLVDHRGCGIFDASATCIAEDDRGLQGAALITTVSATTAHLAQLAVRPDCRGRGLAGALLAEASARSAQAGRSEMTLLVGEGNTPAWRLYDAMGFRRRALFIAADRQESSCCSAGAPVSSATLAAAPARSTAVPPRAY